MDLLEAGGRVGMHVAVGEVVLMRADLAPRRRLQQSTLLGLGGRLGRRVSPGTAPDWLHLLEVVLLPIVTHLFVNNYNKPRIAHHYSIIP